MSYCVNCGVELDATAQFCPLCRTLVRNPRQPADRDSPPPFPAERGEVSLTFRRSMAVLVSAMLASVSACCALLNLFLPAGRLWSLYVIGAAGMLWVFLTPPMLCRRLPAALLAVLDTAAVGLYLLLIAWELGGLDWYFHLALPIVALLGTIMLVLVLLLQGRRRSLLSSAALLLGAAGVFVAGLELMADLYLHGRWQPTWSMVVLVVIGALEVPLLVVRRVPALREEARRRFHL